MGASNFHRGNTSKVFAVLMDREETFKECSECGHKHYDYEYSLDTLNECEDGCEGATFSEEQTEYRSCESYEYYEFKEYLRETAQEEAKELKTIWYKEESGSDNDRNYCSTDLFSYSTSKMFGDIEIEVRTVKLFIKAKKIPNIIEGETELDNVIIHIRILDL